MKKNYWCRFIGLATVFVVFLGCSSLKEKKRGQEQYPLPKQVPKEQKPSEKEDLAVKIDELLNKIVAAAERVEDYTCIFTKQEYVKGKMRPTETIFMKHKKEPHSVYMKWVKKPYLDRECLYSEGKYDNKLKVHEGHGLKSLFGTLSLNPKGAMAMKGNRHAITKAGIFNTIRLIEKDFELAKSHPEHNVLHERFEKKEIHGQPSSCMFIVHPKDRELGYYAHKAEICTHQKLHLPTSVKIWDFTGSLVEFYTYREYKINVGLTDKDFDIKNKEYDF